MLKLIVPALAALSLAASAQAKVFDTTTVSVTVPYADLNLATEAGAATLGKRIVGAVRQVCDRPAVRDLQAWASWQKCRDEAMEGVAQQLAAARINAPLVALAR